MNSDLNLTFGETHQPRLAEEVTGTLESVDDVPDYTESDDYEPITRRKAEENLAQLYRDVAEWSVSVSTTHV